jgi:hypothetical protein
MEIIKNERDIAFGNPWKPVRTYDAATGEVMIMDLVR